MGGNCTDSVRWHGRATTRRFWGSLSLWERAGVRVLEALANAPHPNPLPRGEGTEGSRQNHVTNVAQTDLAAFAGLLIASMTAVAS